MPDINSLGLNDEPIEGVDFDEMPQGLGSFPIPPQPGIYEFQLPAAEAIYNSFDVDNSDPEQGQRVVAQFRDAAALKNTTLRNFYNTNISNRTRVINFKSGPVKVSDMAMLLKAVESEPEGNTNAAYAQALVNAGGRKFIAENRLSVKCSPQRDVYKDGKQQEGVKGCGASFSSSPYKDVREVPKDPETGLYMTSFVCPDCGAELRCFGNLQGFRASAG
jgi:hypothetical protein